MLKYTINGNNSQQISNIADENYRYVGDKLAAPPVEALKKQTQEYAYDANGNLISIQTGTKTTDEQLQVTKSRRLLWDEENRLLGISDNGFVSQYWYDASGERTVKASFDNEGVYINGALSGARTGTSKFTAYVSPYLVVSNGGNYTKHVYMGSQRISSKVSNSGIFGTTSPVNTTELQAKYEQQTTKIKERFDSLGVAYSGLEQTGGLVSSTPPAGDIGGCYFYHPDHLGSSSLITDGNGHLVQHIQYVPFGEVFIEQRNSTWSTPYKFNGKELDEETGLAYYHARYYDPRTSVWLSVDPLAERIPNYSSYNYCSNNPVMRIDPTGLADGDHKLTGSSNLLIWIEENPNTVNERGKNAYKPLNKASMDRESGGFDYISVNNIDQVQGLLEKHYGKGQAPTIDNLIIRSHGASSSAYNNYGPDLNMEKGVGVVHSPNSSQGLIYLEGLLSNNANILFTACNAAMNYTNSADQTKHPYSSSLIDKYSKFFLSGTERSLYMNWSKTTARIGNGQTEHFNFNNLLSKDKYGGFMKFTWGNKTPIYDSNFLNVTVSTGGVFSSGGIKTSVINGRKP